MSIENRALPLDRLDPRVAAAALIVGVIEFELFAQPKTFIAVARQDAWLCVLFGSIIATIATYLLLRLAARFPRENLLQYNRKVWGRPVAFGIAAGYFIFWAAYLVLITQEFNTANHLLFLENTPSVVTLLILAFGAAWLVSHGFTAVIRFFQLMLPFLIIPLIFIYVIAAGSIELKNFFPVFGSGILPVLKGAFIYAGALQGIELLLFLSPFLSDVKRSVKPALIGITVVNLAVLSQTVITIGIMGAENIEKSVWPGIDVMTLIEFPGFPVERFELFLSAPWLIGVFTTMCLFLYLVSLGFKQIFNMRDKKAVIYTLAVFTVLATYFIPNFTWAVNIRKNFFIPTLLFVYALPILTLIMANLRGKRD